MTSEAFEHAGEAVSKIQEVLKELGVSGIEVSIINSEQKRELVKYMNQLAEELRDPAYKVNARRIGEANFILLIGLKDGGEIAEMNCGACGFPSCEDMLMSRRAGLLFPGPTCIVGALCLGMVVGSIMGMHHFLNRDCKTMLRIGAAAKRLGFLKSDLVMGLLLA